MHYVLRACHKKVRSLPGLAYHWRHHLVKASSIPRRRQFVAITSWYWRIGETVWNHITVVSVINIIVVMLALANIGNGM